MDTVKVLIAAEGRDTRAEIAAALADDAQIVAEISDGSRALTMARSLCPEIAILEAGLPETDGFDVAKALRAENLAAPVLIVERCDPVTVMRAVACGALALVARPITSEQLGSATRLALASHRERRGLIDEINELRERLQTRKVIGRAKAFLMERYNLTEREAFHRIQAQSQLLGRPPHEIAQAIITASEVGGYGSAGA